MKDKSCLLFKRQNKSVLTHFFYFVIFFVDYTALVTLFERKHLAQTYIDFDEPSTKAFTFLILGFQFLMFFYRVTYVISKYCPFFTYITFCHLYRTSLKWRNIFYLSYCYIALYYYTIIMFL